MSRTPFSINLDEDYEIYGIDPNENLDDWSFLEAKPEPIPEKDEEERRLFEQLLKPSIPDEEIQAEIHDRLKSLLEETSKFIENDVKVELSAPIEISPEQIQQNINKESFEHKQAERVSTIVKDILRTTQESEDIDNLIQSLTKSDKIADLIKAEEEKEEKKEEKHKGDQKSKKSFSKSSPANISSKDDNKNGGKNEENVQAPKQIPAPEKKEQTGFLDRYKRKPGTKATILRDHDETERLSSKFLLDKKKREEEDQKELERKMKEREEKQKKFFESLDLEAEKHRREVQMIKEIQESKAPTLSEMLNQIKTPEQSKPEINPQLAKAKTQKKQEKPPRYSNEKIDEFFAIRQKKLQLKPPKPPIMIELATDKIKSDPKENVLHFSKTYQKNVTSALAEKLKPLLKDRKRTDPTKLWKILIFFRLSKQLSLNRLSKSIKQYKLKVFLRKWRRRRLFSSLRKQISAMKIQSAFRKFRIKKKQEINEKSKKKNITDQQILDKARQMVTQNAPESAQQKIQQIQQQNQNQNQNYQQQRPTKKPDFRFPVLKDPDMSWIDNFEKDEENSLNFSDDDILEELPNKPIIRSEDEKPKSARAFQAESQSEPVDFDAYGYLSRFGQKIDLGDNPEGETEEIESKDEKTKTKTSTKTPEKQANATNNTAQSPQQNDANQSIIDNQNSEMDAAPPGSYNFKNKSTAKMMQKMMNKKYKQSNPYKDEKPVEKFNRLYGGPSGPATQAKNAQKNSSSANPKVRIQNK